MNGLLDDLIKKSAMFFLYIFVDPTGALPSPILAKRKVQDKILKLVAGIDLFHSYDYYKNLIYTAIVDQYKLTPHQMLEAIYLTAVKNQGISGIGTETLPENYEPLESTTDAVSDIYFADGTVKKGTTDKNIWKDISEVIKWLAQLITSIKGKESDTYAAPNYTDWKLNGSNSGYNNTSTADISTYLPYIVAAGIGITLLMGSKKSK